MNEADSRFTVLDSWRGVCAVIVVIYHFPAMSHLLFQPFFRHGWLFVDFFFVLSGFVITHSYEKRLGTLREFASFVIRRFGRVWPLHVAMLLPFLALELLKLFFTGHGFSADRPPFTGQMSPMALAANVFLLQTMGLLPDVSWNLPSWSIGVEYWSYLVFGLCALLSSGPQRARFRLPWLLFAILAASLATLLVYPKRLEVITPYGFPRCLFGFIGGYFAYRLWRLNSRLKSSTLVEMAAVIVVCAFVTYCATTLFAFLSPLVFGSAIIVFAQGRGAVSGLLRRAPLLLLGRLSFSIYMAHWFLHDTFRKVLAVFEQKSGVVVSVPVQFVTSGTLGTTKVVVWGGPFFSDLLLVLFIAIVVGVSALTFRFIEKPGQRLFGRLARNVLVPMGRERDMPIPDPKPL